LIWAIGISIAVGKLTAGGQIPVIARVFPPTRDVVIVGLVAWFLIRLNRAVVDSLQRRARAENRHFDMTSAEAVSKTLTACVAVIAALAVMQTLGLSPASLLAFGGVTGVALGFAAQGLVANLLGGITIFASK